MSIVGAVLQDDCATQKVSVPNIKFECESTCENGVEAVGFCEDDLKCCIFRAQSLYDESESSYDASESSYDESESSYDSSPDKSSYTTNNNLAISLFKNMNLDLDLSRQPKNGRRTHPNKRYGKTPRPIVRRPTKKSSIGNKEKLPKPPRRSKPKPKPSVIGRFGGRKGHRSM